MDFRVQYRKKPVDNEIKLQLINWYLHKITSLCRKTLENIWNELLAIVTSLPNPFLNGFYRKKQYPNSTAITDTNSDV